MKDFGEFYKQLNANQKKAVDTIEGPVMVIAGPGTGKTQLLSLRVANILKSTDIGPQNILCLTFTDNAANNMRERLERMIGMPAYHVNVNTFHSFGDDIINQYPDHFTHRQLIQPVDELGTYELLRSIFEKLPYDSPLATRVGDEYIFLPDTQSIIGWLKANALSPAELREILKENDTFTQKANSVIGDTFATSASAKQLPKYEALLHQLTKIADGANPTYGFAPYGQQVVNELQEAIEKTDPNGRYATLITAWRNTWLEKTTDKSYRFKDSNRNAMRMQAVADVYEDLLKTMSDQGLYDFDDMIVEVVHALENDEELRLNLQERYQYILVDEFQDTNKAQLRIVQALGNNPINEGSPNIMVVGDDDQAIYAFQGAESSNMRQFMESYHNITLITLTDNYRSTKEILDISLDIVRSSNDRLEGTIEQVDKSLQAHAKHPKNHIAQSVFVSELEQYAWIANQIENYIKAGHAPQNIAVIAPRHKYLERLMPYLAPKVPVAYERRENILDAPIIVELTQIAKLVDAIATGKQDDIDALLGEVLSFRFWNILTETLMELSIKAYDSHSHWLPLLLNHTDKKLRDIGGWLTSCARDCHLQPLEYLLDRFVGTTLQSAGSDNSDDVVSEEGETFISPLREYYFSKQKYETSTDDYLSLLGQLSTLRHRLRNWKPNRTLYLPDLIEFIELHKRAKLKIVDSNPHTQTTNAVQVMTPYKAKGLEFDIVFIINAQDDVWGVTARKRSARIRLPANLNIKPVGDGLEDKLRLLFVALTRAKHTLQVTSYSNTMDNKRSLGLSFIGGNSPDTEVLYPALAPKTVTTTTSVEAVELLTTDWEYRYKQVIADKPTLLEPVLKNYKLSVTHLNNFIDIVDAGPDYFLVHNLLRFPEAITPPAAYGDAIHKTLQWMHGELKQKDGLPNLNEINTYFSDILSRKHLRKSDLKKLTDRGKNALKNYVKVKGKDFNVADFIERGFNNEGVVINGARLSGKIDKITRVTDTSAVVVDFKTGKPSTSWQGKDDYERIKLHKYRQQLMFYKLLVENAASFHGRLNINHGELEFIEADENGKLVDNLELTFDTNELTRFATLIKKIWEHIQDLNFPNISGYSKDSKGIQQFEDDLISDKI